MTAETDTRALEPLGGLRGDTAASSERFDAVGARREGPRCVFAASGGPLAAGVTDHETRTATQGARV